MSTTTNLTNLIINYLTQAQYDEALANNTINENQLYFTPDRRIWVVDYEDVPDGAQPGDIVLVSANQTPVD